MTKTVTTTVTTTTVTKKSNSQNSIIDDELLDEGDTDDDNDEMLDDDADEMGDDGADEEEDLYEDEEEDEDDDCNFDDDDEDDDTTEPEIYEDERDELGYRVCVELPGVAKESATVKVVEGDLVIEATRESDDRKFYAEYPLEDDDNVDTISSKMADGLLKICVNKKTA
jgi:HSP20 family molecular chaperone IbpA